MSPEKDEMLCKKYPKIFKDRNASPQETCMCWGMECDDGWFALLETLCACIQNHVDQTIQQQKYKKSNGSITPEELIPEEDIQVVASQVKSKFGGLRFYYDGGDDFVSGLVRMAEGISYNICEHCGESGKKQGRTWSITLCDSCNEKRIGLREKK